MSDAIPRTLWRISNHVRLDGNGGKKSGARWHSMGRRIVYLADSPMAALVETLVHLDIDSEDTPDSYILLNVAVPKGLRIKSLEPPDGDDWKENPALTQADRRCVAGFWRNTPWHAFHPSSCPEPGTTCSTPSIPTPNRSRSPRSSRNALTTGSSVLAPVDGLPVSFPATLPGTWHQPPIHGNLTLDT